MKKVTEEFNELIQMYIKVSKLAKEGKKHHKDQLKKCKETSKLHKQYEEREKVTQVELNRVSITIPTIFIEFSKKLHRKS